MDERGKTDLRDIVMDSKLQVYFPPDPNPRKPRFVVPPGSWDTHFHVYAPHLFPFAEKRRAIPPAAPVEHYLKISAAIGLQRGVIVQPSMHGNSTDVVLDAVAKSEDRLRGMIIAKPTLIANQVKALHAGGVRGPSFHCAARPRKQLRSGPVPSHCRDGEALSLDPRSPDRRRHNH